MKELSRIQRALKAPKNETNRFGGYRYRKAEDILAAVKQLLEEGEFVTLTDNIVYVEGDETRIVKVNKTDTAFQSAGRFFMKATATFTCPSGSISTEGWAELDDHPGMSREQSIGASSSYSRKYALCGLFALDDSSADPDTTSPVAGEQWAKEIAAAKTREELDEVWNKYVNLQGDQQFLDMINKKAVKLQAN